MDKQLAENKNKEDKTLKLTSKKSVKFIEEEPETLKVPKSKPQGLGLNRQSTISFKK